MKKAHRQSNAERRHFAGPLSTIVLSVLIVVMVTTLVMLVWRQSTQPLVIADYEGMIIERWGDDAESEQGSRPRFHLLVESQDRKRFTVNVDPTVYESSKIGMRIKSRSGQVVLIDSDRKTTNDK